jgi:hypothetical protein
MIGTITDPASGGDACLAIITYSDLVRSGIFIPLFTFQKSEHQPAVTAGERELP